MQRFGRVWTLLAIALLTGCNEQCIDGVCPDTSASTPRPGPCHSATRQGNHCTYSYDAVGHVTLVDCTDARTTWTWDANAVLGIAESNGTTWTFDAQRVTTGALVYDRAAFAFLPLVGTRVISPKADLGLLSEGTTTFTWQPSPGGLEQTSSANEVVFYMLDDRGRITSIVPGPATGRVPGKFTFVYDGDLLVGTGVVSGVLSSGTELIYDRGGNLVEEDDRDSQDTMTQTSEAVAYDYSCW